MGYPQGSPDDFVDVIALYSPRILSASTTYNANQAIDLQPYDYFAIRQCFGDEGVRIHSMVLQTGSAPAGPFTTVFTRTFGLGNLDAVTSFEFRTEQLNKRYLNFRMVTGAGGNITSSAYFLGFRLTRAQSGGLDVTSKAHIGLS